MIVRTGTVCLLVAVWSTTAAAQTTPAKQPFARLRPTNQASATQSSKAAGSAESKKKAQEKPNGTSPSGDSAAAQAEALKKMQQRQQEAEQQRMRTQLLQQLRFGVDAAGFLRAWAEEGQPGSGDEREETTRGGDVPAGQQFQQELEMLKKAVLLAKWEAVREILAGWPKQDARTAYQKLLTSLVGRNRASIPSSGIPVRGFPGAASSRTTTTVSTHLTADDLVGIVFAAPEPLQATSLALMGQVVRQVISAGVPPEVLARRFHRVVTQPAEDKPKWLDRAAMVDLLFAAELAEFAVDLLPAVEEAKRESNMRAVNQWAQIFESRFDRDSKRSDLIQAWELTRVVLLEGKRGDKETRAAIRRAVGLAHKLDDELGRKWLADSFTKNPARGRDVIAAIGVDYAQASAGMMGDPESRRRSLALQKMAVEALIESAPQQAKQWQKTLDVLALNWIREAKLAYRHVARGRRMLRYDPFGNPYYIDESQLFGNRSSSSTRPIVVDDLLELEPNDQWRSLLSEGLIPNLTSMRCRLHMKVGDSAAAYRELEFLAKRFPLLAKDLVGEFIDRWRENHKLNSGQIPRNPFMVVYGFSQRAEGIPLTRSKQERNMRDLAKWVAQLRKLDLGELDEDRLVAAFTDAHSVAEVYKLETIERVFGPMDTLSVPLVAKLLDRMRGNLSGIWRDPRYQQAMKTKRRKKDIEREVERGYRVALEVVEQALARHPDSWELPGARAALLIDRLNYRKEIEKSDSSFAQLHSEAMSGFARGAERYRRVVAELPKEEWTVEPYQKWFYAALGSADIRGIHPDKVVDRSQIEKIAAALKSLPAPADRWHMAQFASSLYTRMSAVNPGSKFLYLEAGFEIVGDHKLAREARRLYDYYRDLVTEIRFEVVLDSEDVRVGSDRPFGVFVQFRHTKEIERETGGFAKYTTNQNQVYYAYNYGRPLADYRDRFEEAARKALEEDFEVLSIVYNGKDVHSKATDEPGWRITPYAYILLKARGPHVDRVPALKIDLDFTDTSGYVVLPVESSPLSIDASAGPAQPVVPSELTLIQTLDERRASEGELILEVKATGLGRIPELDRLLKIAPPGFEVAQIDDQGVTVSQFAEDIDETAVVCQRLWLIHFRAATADGEPAPRSFVFGEPLVDVKEALYQRYVDEDLVSVEKTVPLESQYAEAPASWWVIAGASALGAAILILGIGLWRRATRKPLEEADRIPLPDQVNAFTVVGWLRHLDQAGLVADDSRKELASTIARLEQAFFAESDGKEIDLQATLERWRCKV